MNDALMSRLNLSALELAFARFLQQAQPSANERHAILAALASFQFSRGHACLDLHALASQPAELLGWTTQEAALLPAGLVESAGTVPWTQGDASPLVLESGRLYLRRAWRAEGRIRSAIASRLAQSSAAPAGLRGMLDSLFPEPEAASHAVPWQKLACALAVRGQLTLITGGPGTGKTTTVARLLALLQAQANASGLGLRVALAAPTGKAAARLESALVQAGLHLPAGMKLQADLKAMTLHRLLHVSESTGSCATPVAADVVVVDEASMIDLEMTARLLAAVPLSARLILLGDKDQLASVEAGAVLAQLCAGAEAGQYDAKTVTWAAEHAGIVLDAWTGDGDALAQQTVMLRESHRFGATSQIGQWARAVNAGDVANVEALIQSARDSDTNNAGLPEQSVAWLGAHRSSEPAFSQLVRSAWHEWRAAISTWNDRSRDLADLAESAGRDEDAAVILTLFAKFQVLCATREGRFGTVRLNREIARLFGFPVQGWYAGRPVMVTRNDYSLNLMNGDLGICMRHGRGLRLAFPSGNDGVRWIQPSRLDACETVFAMTIHKSQGSEFDHVLLALPEADAAVLTRELVYTGVTRARRRLTVMAPSSNLLLRAVSRRVNRSGGLCGG
jgi:exodeoxyribonuclease V alpha subunit